MGGTDLALSQRKIVVGMILLLLVFVTGCDQVVGPAGIDETDSLGGTPRVTSSSYVRVQSHGKRHDLDNWGANFSIWPKDRESVFARVTLFVEGVRQKRGWGDNVTLIHSNGTTFGIVPVPYKQGLNIRWEVEVFYTEDAARSQSPDEIVIFEETVQ